ncbi:MAG: hypothetical protein RML34_11625 [Leptospiraceae bacterium]|nr:hypothetical protein [Leptospiraceae bacterium]
MKFKLALCLLVTAVSACPSLLEKEKKIIWEKWHYLVNHFGHFKMRVPPPCVRVGQHYFQSIYNGNKLRSAYDEEEHVVYLRTWDVRALEHELGHAYLSKRYGSMPYPLSEKLTRCLYERPLITQTKITENELRNFLMAMPSDQCVSKKAAFYLLRLSFEDWARLFHKQ